MKGSEQQNSLPFIIRNSVRYLDRNRIQRWHAVAESQVTHRAFVNLSLLLSDSLCLFRLVV
jgi:hypothetical protein